MFKHSHIKATGTATGVFSGSFGTGAFACNVKFTGCGSLHPLCSLLCVLKDGGSEGIIPSRIMG